jgi:hypothetical protein
MTKTEMARPATTGKRGFSLQLFNFRKSIDKALTLRPRVVYHSLEASDVERSDGLTFARVTFASYDGGLWACCDCPAAHRGLPCYHVAAAAIARDILTLPAGAEIAVENKPIEEAIYHTVARTDQARDRFRPRFEMVDESEPTTPAEGEQHFNWQAYRRVPDSQLKDGWQV